MNRSRPRHRSLLSAAIGAVLMFGLVSQATAQSSAQRERQQGRPSRDAAAAKAPPAFPNATRVSPKKTPGKSARKLQQMIKLGDDEKAAEARAIADEVIANDAANPYERAFAAQYGAQMAYQGEDSAAAIQYLTQALSVDGLDNENHFNSMWLLAQLQMQEEQYPQSLATVDRLMAETASRSYDQLLHKGRVLNRMDRAADAIMVLKEAQAAAPADKKEWQSELMFAYAETDQGAEAAVLAEALAAQNPDDKRSQMRLAATYQQADMLDKSAQVLEKLRVSGQFTSDTEYRQLYSTYLNLEGREKDAAVVINDGIEKGVLKPDFQVYLALAQAYYFSEQFAPAIEAYKKAAPLDDDGETYLNLARLLWQEERMGEAKEAARQALTKGLKKPDDAKKIIAL